jgi:hypothetical protein
MECFNCGKTFITETGMQNCPPCRDLLKKQYQTEYNRMYRELKKAKLREYQKNKKNGITD